MKLLIFGASGHTGQLVVKEALSQGYTVTAFVRNASRMKMRHAHLAITEGSLDSQSDIEKGLEGQDAVISVLGNKTRNALWTVNTTISDGLKHILQAMEKKRVKRLLFVTAFGVNNHIFWPEKLFIRTLLKNIFADIPLQEKLIRESNLDWTIIRPARLTDVPKTGKYRAGEELGIGLFSQICRADVADFLIKSITEKDTFHKILTLISS